MGEKDIVEKTLEAYNEVFADIVNVLLFNGEQIILPEDLVDQTPRAMYKADDKIREVERDVAKRWVRNNIRIACIGLENQTKADPYIPLRVMGYDGVEYRTQLRDLKEGEKPSPVVTLVLYFGYKGHWNAPLSLSGSLEIPEVLKPYVSDIRVNLFEIAYLSWEQVNLFRSDFREVARYFVQMREDGEYRPSDDELDHIESVLQLLNVMDKDHRFETAINERNDKKKEVRKMSEWLTKVINENQAIGEVKGIAKGRAEGIAKGRAEGEANGMIKTLAALVRKNLLSVKDAAEQANMSEAAFCEKAGLPIPQ